MPRQKSESRSGGSVRRQSSRSSHNFAAKPSRGSSKDLPAVQQPKESHPATAPPAASTTPAAEAKGPSTGERFKDMATTAAGVAAGSAVGHAVGAGLTGMFQGRGQTAAPQEKTQQPQEGSSAPRPLQLVEDGPCAFELRQFLKCTEQHGKDLSACQEFNEAMQQCRRRYNV
ncbi:coiled-coil-helix-coiled-coil-helix domain-containing protein 10, mitochondrial [Drosophila ficusphila]|uniref:coiled-coil-helix-coiled-coil-helix domain-containing protein 10, mitochondrial n=1 Tax=Drosophila ficusphila TaxID=30025 RepID=UPI0007E754A0|nr:coiled-coil-helix-coiled-coil-helix domain-containing protein 10, mitochondrial [Drosophila ficusphila]